MATAQETAMSVLNDLAALHVGFRRAMSIEPTRLYIDPIVRVRLDRLQPTDWPFQHLAERAAEIGTDTAIAEMFGVTEMVAGHTTRFE